MADVKPGMLQQCISQRTFFELGSVTPVAGALLVGAMAQKHDARLRSVQTACS